MKVFVITLRGLHLGHVGCYGNDWIETPTLDRLAAEGVVFDQHLADHPDPEGARLAWRTGQYHFPTSKSPPDPPADLLALLRAHRITTYLVHDPRRQPASAFAAAWDHVGRIPAAGEGSTLERSLEAAVEALDRLATQEHWLLWLELDTLLPPWDVPEEFLARYFEADQEPDEEDEQPPPLTPSNDLVPGAVDVTDDRALSQVQLSYAGAVTYLDSGLGLLLEEVQQRDPEDQICLLVTSDHGQPLGEHGVIGDSRPWLHEELIHIPLIVRRPTAAEAGLRVAALTQAVDLMPTLLDLFGVPLPAVHGHSLLPLLSGATEPVRAYACAGLRRGAAVELALRTPEWAYLLPLGQADQEPLRRPQLYVKPDDRWEVNNVLQHHLELAEQLDATLRGFADATRS